MVAHACDPSTQEIEAGGSPQVPGHPGLYNKTLKKVYLPKSEIYFDSL